MQTFLLGILKILIPSIISILLIFIARYFEKQKEIESRIRNKKIVIYETFAFKVFSYFLKNAKSNEKQKEKLLADMAKVFEDFHKNLLFWGSDEIIKKYNTFRLHMIKGNSSLEELEEFFFELRKDAGHKNKNLKKYDLIKLFLNGDSIDEKGDVILTT